MQMSEADRWQASKEMPQWKGASNSQLKLKYC